MLNELMNIIKEFATHKNRVWFYNPITRQRVEVKRDAYRRYYDVKVKLLRVRN